jgi:uncharacterized protein YjbI with pentapeptide repeats
MSKLPEADLTGANLREANLTGANLLGARLNHANLSGAILVGTNLEKADLSACRVYGISAWDVNLTDTTQENMIVTPEEQPEIQVDRLDVAQFIYLLLNNAAIRNVIDTITSKVVLILGRFTEDRKTVLRITQRATGT